MAKFDDPGFWVATAIGIASFIAAGVLVWYAINLPAPTP